MICTTIQNKGQEQVLEALEQCEMAEIRLDRCPLSMEDIDVCFSSDVPLVATCRIEVIMENEPSLQVEGITPQSREIKAAQIAEKRLCRAIEAGARYVDVELEAPKQMSKRVRGMAHENGTVFIRSYHDFERTDSFEALKALVEKCRYHGADVVKIVTMAHSQEDVDRVMSLYDWDAKENGTGRLIAFCMGDTGRESRLECLRRGAPFTYAALVAEDAAAPGQWPAADMAKAVYGDFRFVGSCSAQGLENEDSAVTALQMPSSKSFAQRAIIAAALADGVSHLRGYTPCGDNDAAVDVARAIGAEVNMDGNELTIKGIAASLGSVALSELHVGESGLLTRMMLPLMAQLSETPVTVTGEKTLLERPLTGASEIMEAFGAKVKNASGAAGPEQEGNCLKVPFEVIGPLSAGRAEVSG